MKNKRSKKQKDFLNACKNNEHQTKKQKDFLNACKNNEQEQLENKESITQGDIFCFGITFFAAGCLCGLGVSETLNYIKGRRKAKER